MAYLKSITYKNYLFLLAAWLPPPKRIPAPSTNPKSYQPPLLCTSYKLTLSVKTEITKVNGAIIPCQIPVKKPATECPGIETSTKAFGPGKQADKETRTIATAINKMYFLLIIQKFK